MGGKIENPITILALLDGLYQWWANFFNGEPQNLRNSREGPELEKKCILC